MSTHIRTSRITVRTGCPLSWAYRIRATGPYLIARRFSLRRGSLNKTHYHIKQEKKLSMLVRETVKMTNSSMTIRIESINTSYILRNQTRGALRTTKKEMASWSKRTTITRQEQWIILICRVDRHHIRSSIRGMRRLQIRASKTRKVALNSTIRYRVCRRT